VSFAVDERSRTTAQPTDDDVAAFASRAPASTTQKVREHDTFVATDARCQTLVKRP